MAKRASSIATACPPKAKLHENAASTPYAALPVPAGMAAATASESSSRVPGKKDGKL
jgi:hypothetical protein